MLKKKNSRVSLYIPISHCNQMAQMDKLIWKHTPNGIFSVKSVYRSTFGDDLVPPGMWRLIWTLHIPPKLNTFLWLFYRSKLLTNVNRVARHITSDPCCKHCPGQPETMLHLFRDCPRVSRLWHSIGGPETIRRTFSLDWDAWIAANILQPKCMYWGFQWVQLFIFTCWFIWKWRNNFIFDENFADPHNPIKVLILLWSTWLNGVWPLLATILVCLFKMLLNFVLD